MTKFIKIFTVSIIAILIVSALFWRYSQKVPLQPGAKTLAITQIVTHPALDSVRVGLLLSLSKAGWQEGKNLNVIYENAHGNIATANQIAYKFASIEPDVIVAIATPVAQAVISTSRDKNVPIVFSAVSDPLGAKLVSNLERPGGMITGTSDHPPVAEQIALIREFFPEDKKLTLGMLYNAGEANSVAQVALTKQFAQMQGITILARSVDSATKVASATQSLIQEVDAIYLPLDNTVASALPAVFETTFNNPSGKKVPVFASDPEVVQAGALATVGFTHFHEGQLTGNVVNRILSGEHPGNISVKTPQPARVYLNQSTADKLEIEIPEAVQDRAEKIYP